MSEKQAEWLTPDEAAELLRVNRETIYRQIRRGALPAVRVGRAYRISRDAVTAAETASQLAEPRAAYDAAVPVTRWVAPLDDISEIVAIEDDVEFIRKSAGMLGTGPLISDEELEQMIEAAMLEDLLERMRNW